MQLGAVPQTLHGLSSLSALQITAVVDGMGADKEPCCSWHRCTGNSLCLLLSGPLLCFLLLAAEVYTINTRWQVVCHQIRHLMLI